MAREAVCDELYAERVLIGIHFKIHALKAFEALVRADEREAFAKIQFESILQAIKIEREACAKVCDELAGLLACHGDRDGADLCVSLRDTIRARGNT
jgi:hypothetical protein